MSIPALNTSSLTGVSSYTQVKSTSSGRVFKVVAVMTTIISAILLIAALALESLALAIAGTILLTVTVTGALIAYKHGKKLETVTRGEPVTVFVEVPHRIRTPEKAAEVAQPMPNYDRVQTNTPLSAAVEDVRNSVEVTYTSEAKPAYEELNLRASPELTPPKPIAPVAKAPKRGLTAYFSRGASQ